MIKIDLESDCPCQSGIKCRNCCGKRNFKTLRAVTRTPGQKTGFKNPKCYAKAFEDCSEKISREHYLSKGILEVLNENGSLTVDGFPWLQKGESKLVSPNDLTAKILCERHNNALSPLDSIALRFFKTLIEIENEFADRDKCNFERIYLFKGNDLERWMLKTLCGILFSKNASTIDSTIKNRQPELTWLNMIFGTQNFQPRCGIYYNSELNSKQKLYRGFSFAPIIDSEDHLFGAFLKLKEHQFSLMMEAPPIEKKNTFLEHYVYRPYTLITSVPNNTTRKIVIFQYDSFDEKTEINLTLNFSVPE